MLRFALVGWILLVACWMSAPTVHAQNLALQLERIDPHGYGDGAAWFAGLRASSSKHQGPGADFWLGVWPEAIVEGALVSFADLDFAYTVPLLDRLEVVPRAGGSVLLVSAGSFGGAGFGWNAGVGVIGRLRPGFGVRGDYTLREPFVSGSGDPARLSAVSLGLFWTLGPRSAARDALGSGHLAAGTDSTGAARPGRGSGRALIAVVAVFGAFSAWVLTR